ncbi:uncharacterized protein PG998_001402 [Apiospora kogelbergensis]|uniref:uncharacterized protein n=1 Tax=Apiospora kogelbergensis TaxID=1337665 RepID=UPI00312EDA52
MDEDERLTSSSGVTGNDGLSPLSSSVHSGSSQSSQAGGIPPYSNPQGHWALTQNSSYTYSTLGQSQPGLMQSSYGGRQQLYSPSGNAFGSRSSQSPATGEGLVAPPYDNVGPPSLQQSLEAVPVTRRCFRSPHTMRRCRVIFSAPNHPPLKRRLRQLRHPRIPTLDPRRHPAITRRPLQHHSSLRSLLSRIPIILPLSHPPQLQGPSHGEYRHSAHIILCMRQLITPAATMEGTLRWHHR